MGSISHKLLLRTIPRLKYSKFPKMKASIFLLFALASSSSSFKKILVPPPNPDCTCTELTIFDDRTETNIGNCLTADRSGRFFCYVQSTSGCLDKRSSSRVSGLFFSYEACEDFPVAPAAAADVENI